MRVSRRARAARWGGAVLVALAPLPWLGIGTAVADPPGNNGTLKVHEQGTPSGFEDNDPKVCVFNFEGFSFDVGQTGYIMIDGQGQTTGSYGPLSFGPTNSSGFYATSYVNDGGLSVPDGHYKATLYGKDVPQDDAEGQQGDEEVKAKSKVFKVICDEPEPSGTPTTTKPTQTQTTKTSTPTTTTPTVTNTETTPTITETESSTAATNTESTPGKRSPSVKATTLTQPAALPKTGSELPLGAAMAASMAFIGLGVLLLLGPGRLVAERYSRKH